MRIHLVQCGGHIFPGRVDYEHQVRIAVVNCTAVAFDQVAAALQQRGQCCQVNQSSFSHMATQNFPTLPLKSPPFATFIPVSYTHLNEHLII